MGLYSFGKVALPGLAFALACLLPISTHAQANRSITLDPPTGWELQDHVMDSKGNLLPEAPPNFRRLGEAAMGQPAALHTLTLRFSETTRITGISISRDFKIEQGGSCVEGNVYEKGSTCQLLVRFTPQGPGNRLGKLTVTHSASPTPDSFGLGGTSYMPVISFIPSIITTVPGTYPSNKGLLSGASNLAINGGDHLFVADTGNGAIRDLDSSGVWHSYTTINLLPGSGSVTDPVGIAADNFGNAWFSETSQNFVGYTFDGAAYRGNGFATNSCTLSTSPPCLLGGQTVTAPGQMSIDHLDNLLFPEGGLALSSLSGPDPTLAILPPPLLDGAEWNTLAIDAGDHIYFFSDAFEGGGPSGVTCVILSETLDQVENSLAGAINIVGGYCGFSGDGGQASNAEIGTAVGQIAFDAANNLYFTDTNNQRVRRIDYATGIIRTIAGNGTAGYVGDGKGALSAELANPTGLGVDSQGQVYIISDASSTGSAQVIREVEATGYRYFANQVKGTHSPVSTVLVTNTGNSSMTMVNSGFNGADSGDFAIDPLTTNCALTSGAVLAAGQSCRIGFVFTPSAIGSRTATFVMSDNTVNNSNTIDLTGTGILPSTTFTITSPANGASFAHGTSVPFTVSVTSASGPAPTGTVQFKVDGVAFGSPVTVSSGGASTSVTGLSGGSHSLSATYSGDTNYAAGGPISVTITDVLPNATFTVTSPTSGASFTYGASVAFNVSVTSASGLAPTGTVQFKVDGSASGSPVAISSGAASTTLTGLSGGSHSLSATYSGDANYAAGGPVSVTIGVTSAPATVSILSPINGASFPSGVGVPISVSVTASGTAPTGTVQFEVDGSKYGSPVTITSGTASTFVTGLSVTSHTLSATYSGDSYYAPGGPVSVTITVALGTATLMITSPQNGQSFSAGVAVLFNLLVSSSIGPAPTGTVQFKVDGNAFGPPVTISAGAASTTVTGLSVASHTLSVTYSGDANYAPGGPVSVMITVTSAANRYLPIVVMTPMTKSTSCMPQTFDVEVSSASGITPTGTVYLTDNSRTVSMGRLVNGKATLSSPPPIAGSHSFVTRYGGDAHNNLPAASATVVETISQSGRCSQPVDYVAHR